MTLAHVPMILPPARRDCKAGGQARALPSMREGQSMNCRRFAIGRVSRTGPFAKQIRNECESKILHEFWQGGRCVKLMVLLVSVEWTERNRPVATRPLTGNRREQPSSHRCFDSPRACTAACRLRQGDGRGTTSRSRHGEACQRREAQRLDHVPAGKRPAGPRRHDEGGGRQLQVRSQQRSYGGSANRDREASRSQVEDSRAACRQADPSRKRKPSGPNPPT